MAVEITHQCGPKDTTSRSHHSYRFSRTTPPCIDQLQPWPPSRKCPCTRARHEATRASAGRESSGVCSMPLPAHLLSSTFGCRLQSLEHSSMFRVQPSLYRASSPRCGRYGSCILCFRQHSGLFYHPISCKHLDCLQEETASIQACKLSSF